MPDNSVAIIHATDPPRVITDVELLKRAKAFELLSFAGEATLDSIIRVLQTTQKDRPHAAEWAQCFARASPLCPIERNPHGHLTFELFGLNREGWEEVEELRNQAFIVNPVPESCLNATGPDSYDAQHRLTSSDRCRMALITAQQVTEALRTTIRKRVEQDGIAPHLFPPDLYLFAKQLAFDHYGYRKPCAGWLPRIRERISDALLQELNLREIVLLHDPLVCPESGTPYVLTASRYCEGWVHAYYPIGHHWHKDTAFAVIDPSV